MGQDWESGNGNRKESFGFWLVVWYANLLFLERRQTQRTSVKKGKRIYNHNSLFICRIHLVHMNDDVYIYIWWISFGWLSYPAPPF